MTRWGQESGEIWDWMQRAGFENPLGASRAALPGDSRLPRMWLGPLRSLSSDLPDWQQPAELAGALSRPLVTWGDLRIHVRYPRERFEIEILYPYGGRTSYRCTCDDPDCVHLAAGVHALRDGSWDPDWKPALNTVRAHARPPARTVPLALVLNLDTSALDDPFDSLTMRPGLKTKKGTWNKTVPWAALRQGHRGVHFDKAQVEAVAGFVPSDSHYQDLPLHHVPDFWRLVERASEAGIEIAAQDDRGRPCPLELLPDEPATLTVVVRQDDGLQVSTELDTTRPFDTRTLLGTPAHTCILADGPHVSLIPVHSDEVASALEGLGQIHVPAEEADVFLADYLPPIRTSSRVRIEQSTSDLPLVLRAVVRARGADGSRLEWEWAYADQRYPLTGGPGPDPLRQDDLRQQIIDAHPVLEQWIGEPRELGPVESCLFSLEIVPHLQECPQAEVEFVGDPVDYVEADTTEVIWDVDDTDDHDWFDLAVELSVDGTRVPMAELITSLATGQTVLVLPDGRFVDLTSDQMVQMREFLREAAALQVDQRVRVARQRLDLWERLHELGAARAQAPGWKQQVGALMNAGASEVTPPRELGATLRDYQQEGLTWLARRWDVGIGGVLADDMGLGKTLQVLAAILRAHEADPDAPPVLIIAPRSVLRTWRDQAAQFASTLQVAEVTTAAMLGQALADHPHVVVASHQLVQRNAEAYAAIRWSAVVIDEAQAVKNPTTRLHRAVRRLDRGVTFALTGTPMENSVRDVWSLLELVAPGALPPLKEFNEEFRRPIESGHDDKALQRLQRRLAPFLLRRTKSQVASELPDKVEQVVAIELDRDHRAAYRRLLDRERQVILGLLDDPATHRVEILASLTRLRKLAADVGTVERPSAKAAFLVDQIDQLRAEGHRVLVFSQFTTHLRVVAQQLEAAGISHTYLDGTTRRRERVIDEFREGDADAFLISLKAGGVGITLTEADYVFLLDAWWNPAVESQAIDRAHRIGQDKVVNVYRLVSSETVEEKVISLQEAKRTMSDSLWGGMGKVDADEIRGLLE